MFGDIETNPKGYQIKQIDEFSDLFAGATPSTKVSAYWENGTIPWMSSGEVHMGRVTSTEKKISQLGYDKCSTKMVPIHTVVIALAGQGKTRGTVAVTEIELCTNQSLCAMVTDGTVLSDYLYHNLRNRYEEIRSMCAIADGRGGLNLKIVGSIKVIVPSIEEQRQFVAFAEQSDKSKFIGFKSQFIEMFGNPESVIKESAYTVADVAKVQVGLVIKPTRFYSEDGSGIPAFRSLNVGAMEIRDTDWVYFTDEGMKANPRTIVHTGDVLIVRSGYPGTSCVVTPEYDGRNVVDLIIAHPNKDKILPEFLCAYTNFPHGKIQIENAQRGVAQKHFNVSLYERMKIVVPPLQEQYKFVELLQQSDKSKLKGAKE